jgi:signal transduction histidine kinase
MGIPWNEQTTIFEKFYRGKQARDLSGTGTGLGLAIVQQVVEAHGWEVSVESNPDEGSTFIIHLPDGTRTKSEQ